MESCHVSVDHYQAAISLAAPPAGMVQCCPRPGGTKGLTFALSHLKAAPHRASFTLLARCTEPNITGKLLKLKFFDAFMRPVMSYSCKFWAPSASNAALLYLERVHVGFPRRLLGAPQLPSPDAEMGRQPCTTSWSKQVLLDMSYVHLHTAVKVDWSEETLLLTVCRRWAGEPLLMQKAQPLGHHLATIDKCFKFFPAPRHLQVKSASLTHLPSQRQGSWPSWPAN